MSEGGKEAGGERGRRRRKRERVTEGEKEWERSKRRLEERKGKEQTERKRDTKKEKRRNKREGKREWAQEIRGKEREKERARRKEGIFLMSGQAEGNVVRVDSTRAHSLAAYLVKGQHVGIFFEQEVQVLDRLAEKKAFHLIAEAGLDRQHTAEARVAARRHLFQGHGRERKAHVKTKKNERERKERWVVFSKCTTSLYIPLFPCSSSFSFSFVSLSSLFNIRSFSQHPSVSMCLPVRHATVLDRATYPTVLLKGLEYVPAPFLVLFILYKEDQTNETRPCQA